MIVPEFGITEIGKLSPRRSIMGAAVRVFDAVGFRNASIEEVCKVAGVEAFHFYDAFDDLDDVLFTVFEEWNARVLDAIVVATDSAPTDLSVRVEVGLAAFCRELVADPKCAKVVLTQSIGVSTSMENRRRELIWTYADFLVSQIFDLALFSGELDLVKLDRARLRLLSLAVIGGLNRAVVEWIDDYVPGAPTELLFESMTALLLPVFSSIATACHPS